jgi:hypothetical protein
MQINNKSPNTETTFLPIKIKNKNKNIPWKKCSSIILKFCEPVPFSWTIKTYYLNFQSSYLSFHRNHHVWKRSIDSKRLSWIELRPTSFIVFCQIYTHFSNKYLHIVSFDINVGDVWNFITSIMSTTIHKRALLQSRLDLVGVGRWTLPHYRTVINEFHY